MKKFFTGLLSFIVQTVLLFIVLLILGSVSHLIAIFPPLEFAKHATIILLMVAIGYQVMERVGKWMFKD